MIKENGNRAVETISSIAIRLCETISCEECPVTIYEYEKRTPFQKELQHTPCCYNLETWIRSTAKKEEFPIKVIFLDIDGVLNDEQTFIDVHKYWKDTGNRKVEINIDMVKRLKEIVDNTGAKIVLSSSWRFGWDLIKDGECIPKSDHDKELNSILIEHGLSIYSKTGRSDDGKRHKEISEWLRTHQDIVSSFVIIDDETCDLMNYYNYGLVVKTSFRPAGEMIKDMKDCSGLQDTHVLQAIDILNKYD